MYGHVIVYVWQMHTYQCVCAHVYNYSKTSCSRMKDKTVVTVNHAYNTMTLQSRSCYSPLTEGGCSTVLEY